MVTKIISLTDRMSYSRVRVSALLLAGCFTCGACNATSSALESFTENGKYSMMPFLQEWNSGEDFVRLNTAACNQDLAVSLGNVMRITPLVSPFVIKENEEVPLETLSKLLAKFPEVKNVVFPSVKLVRTLLNDPTFLAIASFAWERLDLKDCDLTDNELKIILKRCPKLKSLDLSGNRKLTGNLFSSLHLENLKELTLSGCELLEAGTTIKNLFKLFPDLEKLDLIGVRLTLAEFSLLARFLKLTEVVFHSVFFRPSEVVRAMLNDPTFLAIPSLAWENLNVQSCDLTDDELLKFLDRCPELKRLNISHNKQLTVEILSKVRTEKLEEINLSGCAGMNKDEFSTLRMRILNGESHSLERYLSAVRLLQARNQCSLRDPELLMERFNDYNSLNMKAINSFLKRCPKLEILDISSHFGATEEIFASIHLDQVKELRLANCSGQWSSPRHAYMSDDAMRIMLKACPNIEILDLRLNSEVTGACFSSVILEKLTYLNLYFCDDINDVASIFKGCPNLKKLNFSGAAILLSKDDFSSTFSTNLEEIWISGNNPVFSTIVNISPKLKIVRGRSSKEIQDLYPHLTFLEE